jgi:hypothetical protein
MNHLPAELRGDISETGDNRLLTENELMKVLEGTVCIGVVDRQGKDAAGKRLESEYYYVPDLDTDERRREAVTVGVRKPGLRNCRKQHKVRRPNLKWCRVCRADKPSSNTIGGSQRRLKRWRRKSAETRSTEAKRRRASMTARCNNLQLMVGSSSYERSTAVARPWHDRGMVCPRANEYRPG